MSWININDVLPTVNQQIIFYGPDVNHVQKSNMWLGEYQADDQFLCVLGFHVKRKSVTHWMPVPESRSS
jgi:hypothetical protein